MVDILNPPVQTGDSFSTKYEGSVSATETSYKFPSVQDSIIVRNYGLHYVTATVNGKSVRVGPNGGYFRFTEDSDTVKIKSSFLTSPFTLEGKSFSSGQGAGIDTVARAELQNVTAQLAEKATKAEIAPLANKAEKSEVTAVVNQLTNKAEKSEIQALDTKINSQASGSPKGTYATLSALQTAFPTGNTNIYVVTADGKWYYWNGTAWTVGGTYQSTGIAAKDATRSKIGDKAISYDKTTFLQVISNNLFNKNDITLGSSINTTTGEPSASAANNLSGFIPVLPNTEYNFFAISRYAFYSSSYGFISTATATPGTATTVTTPADCNYMRLVMSAGNTDGAQLNLGNTRLTYDDFKTQLKSVNIGIDNTSNLTAFGFISGKSDSVLIDTASKTLTINNARIIHKNKGHLLTNKTLDLSPFTTDNTYLLYYDTQSGNLNAVLQSATPYAIPETSIIFGGLNPISKLVTNIANYTIDGVKNGMSGTDSTKDYYVLDSDATGVFDLLSTPIDSVATGTTSPLMTKTLDQIYGEYDALMAEFPDYISKTLLCNESTGLPVYRYDFKPSVPTSSLASKKFPKMLFTSGNHHERTGIWCCLQTMKKICKQWRSQPLLDLLRWNCHYIVVPVANPYGFNNGTRTNANGVDLNRNYPNKHIVGTVGSETYGGPNPLSEIEAQKINQIMLDNKDLLYVVDFHNFFIPPQTEYFLWVAGGTLYSQTMGKALISRMSRKWKKDYSFLPQNDTTMFGYTGYTPDGSVASQAYAYGYEGCTFEVSDRNMYELPSYVNNSSLVVTQGTEAFTNWLIMNLKNLTIRK